MKGYQRGDRLREAGSLADVPREPFASQRRMHMSRPEGGSVCIFGRNVYTLTEDVALVTCRACLKLMKEGA